MQPSENEIIEKLKKKKQEELKLRGMLMSIVDEKGMERLDNIKAVNEEKWKKAVNYILMLHQRFGKKFSEKDVIALLSQLNKKTEGKITFIRK